jgi:hypothetical protein
MFHSGNEFGITSLQTLFFESSRSKKLINYSKFLTQLYKLAGHGLQQDPTNIIQFGGVSAELKHMYHLPI